MRRHMSYSYHERNIKYMCKEEYLEKSYARSYPRSLAVSFP